MSQDDAKMTRAERVRARMKQGATSRTRKPSRGRAVPLPEAAASVVPPAVSGKPAVAPPRVSAVTTTVTSRREPPSSTSTPCSMASESIEVFETKRDRVVRTADGEYLDVPEGWELLPPGDAAVTRRVKAAGPCWTVKEKRGRKMFSRGIWAQGESITREVAARAAEIATPAYQKKLARSRDRSAKKQEAYVEDFTASVREFLSFSSSFREMEEQLAQVVSEHATPVGSGTVARTERIPIERRAEAAVIAWMRHQTTAYDTMNIPRVKGKRREVRRMLAERSRQLLERYRRDERVGDERDGQACPLKEALERG